jgi:hypothetical protein
VPLILGFLGLVSFQLYESSPLCVKPTVLTRLSSNRTSVIAYLNTLLHTIASIWVIYFLPVYFQSVLASSPSRSGVQILPTFMILFPFAIISGLVVTKLGSYQPMHHVGVAAMITGFGMFMMLDEKEYVGGVVFYPGIVAAGSGGIVSSLLPAIQVSHDDADAAASTAPFAFTRSFGTIWGVTIPVAVFNNQFSKLLYRILDPAEGIAGE